MIRGLRDIGLVCIHFSYVLVGKENREKKWNKLHWRLKLAYEQVKNNFLQNIEEGFFKLAYA